MNLTEMISLRIAIDLKKNANTDLILNYLFKYTNCRSTTTSIWWRLTIIPLVRSGDWHTDSLLPLHTVEISLSLVLPLIRKRQNDGSTSWGAWSASFPSSMKSCWFVASDNKADAKKTSRSATISRKNKQKLSSPCNCTAWPIPPDIVTLEEEHASLKEQIATLGDHH